MENIEERLDRWQRAGLITRSQAESIRSYERSRPRARAGEGWSMPAPRYVAPAPLPRPTRGRAEPPPSRPPLGRPAAPAPAALAGPTAGRPALLDDSGEPLIGGLPFPAPDGRIVGLAMALLALAGTAAGIFSVTLDLLVAPTHNAGGDLEDLLHLAASLLGVVGGLRMAMGGPSGRPLVLASLGINLAATVVLSLHRLGQAGTVFEVLLWIVLGVIVAASRFDRSTRTFQG